MIIITLGLGRAYGSAELGVTAEKQKEDIMRKFSAAMAMMLVSGLFLAVDSHAQQGMNWKGSRGWGPGSAYGRMYNPKTVETLSGDVVSIDKMAPMKGMHYGIHLMLKTAKETIAVHLGPSWYIENQDVKIEPQDKLEIKGSRVTFEGKPVLIAADVKKGDEILRLRDDKGYPVWAGWRKK